MVGRRDLSYGAQVRAYGRYEKVTFGTNKQGWNRTRAELETERIVQQIERGTWVPPRLEPREDRLEEAMAALGVQVDETFRAFAQRWWRSKQLDLAEKTFVDYSWRLGYLQRFFGRYRLSEITPRLVDRFRDELAEQAQTIRVARAERAAADGDRDRQARPDLRAPAPTALEHLDQHADHAARADPPAGRRLRADRPQPRARRRALGALPQARAPEPDVPRGRRVPRPARRRRPSSRPRRRRTARASVVGR